MMVTAMFTWILSLESKWFAFYVNSEQSWFSTPVICMLLGNEWENNVLSAIVSDMETVLTASPAELKPE